MNKNYFVRAEIEEGYPDYEFIVKAETQKEAEDKFFEGEYEITDDSEWGQNYIVENIIRLDIK